MAIVLMNTWVNCKLYKTTFEIFLKLDRRTSMNQLHRDLSLLKVSDIHAVSLLCFVCEWMYDRQMPRNFCFITFGKLVPWARTEIGLSSCNIKEARLWNENFEAINSDLYKLCFKAKVTKHFKEKYLWYLYKTSTDWKERKKK